MGATHRYYERFYRLAATPRSPKEVKVSGAQRGAHFSFLIRNPMRFAAAD